MQHQPIIRVAAPVPLRRDFDFLPNPDESFPSKGARVLAPFGRRTIVGVVSDIGDSSDLTPDRLKPILKTLDSEPVVPDTMVRLIRWISRYYQQPLGLVWQTALPKRLRQRNDLVPRLPVCYRLTAGCEDTCAGLKRAPLQQTIVSRLRAAPEQRLDEGDLVRISRSWKPAVQSLMKKGWVTVDQCREQWAAPVSSHIQLTAEQQTAVQTVRGSEGFDCTLLFGVTGSGKTEVYMECVRDTVLSGKQAIVLVPEISLTPQLVKRFSERFPGAIALLHSGLTDSERHYHWWRARDGKASVILGTRSAVFTPLKNPGIIVVDEEHDASYKQQDGVRYHARDVAVYRGKLEGIPVLMGSATPSLESLYNVGLGKYRQIELTRRAKVEARLPAIRFIDLRTTPVEDGISKPLLEALKQRFARGEQSLLFINRRGYAPVWCCYVCGWHCRCNRCDAFLTFHKSDHKLLCHHCGHCQQPGQSCPECGSDRLGAQGVGTQRIEQNLEKRLPDARILRIDRDSTRRKGALESNLERVHERKADILVGTQLLTKGHDFPHVTLVGVVNADQGLYSVDYRATESLFQQLMQVAGRAGRGMHAGDVLIQTLSPEHPVFRSLERHDYRDFSSLALEERRQASYPPYARFALFRAESTGRQSALLFLREVRKRLSTPAVRREGVEVMDVVPSPMEKRSGRYRAQLLVRAAQPGALGGILGPCARWIEHHPQAKQVRWSIDIDPMDTY